MFDGKGGLWFLLCVWFVGLWCYCLVWVWSMKLGEIGCFVEKNLWCVCIVGNNICIGLEEMCWSLVVVYDCVMIVYRGYEGKSKGGSGWEKSDIESDIENVMKLL